MKPAYRPAYRIISTFLLAVFLWTLGGLFEVAYAIKDRDGLSVKSDERKLNQSPTPNAQAPRKARPEEKFSTAIEDVENILRDDKVDHETKKQRIRAKKSDIDANDIEIRKQFAEVEGKIKDLPEVIKKRHRDFVKHYDDNFREMKANIDDIDKAKTDTEREHARRKAKAHLEKVKPPKRYKTLDPDKLPHRTPEIKEFKSIEKQHQTPAMKEQQSASLPIQVATIGSLAGLLAANMSTPGTTRQTAPTVADLAETMEVQLTPEIRAKALELGNNPVKLYEFVHNSIEYEPYYGSLKGAHQTLAELAGNDIDQSSLLIALLRAANIPARYVSGTIELPLERLMNWIGGIKDPMTAARILATNCIPGTLLTEGGQVKYVQFEHAWVEAYVDMFPSMGAIQRQASYWTPLDASMKETESSDSINISKTVPFDETTYLSSGDDMPPVLSYIYKLKDYYNTNYDYNFMKIFHVSVKKRQEFGILMGTLPYKVITEQRYAELPDAKRHKISLGLSNDGIGTVSVTKAYPEIAGKKITITFTAASAHDRAVIDSYGGLLKTPAYLISVKPEIKLDDVTILTGPEVGLGAPMSLTSSLTSPNMSGFEKIVDISHGISYAVGLPALHYSGMQLVGQIDRMRVLEGTLHDSINAMDARAGELLHNIAIEYFGQLNNISRSIEGIMHVQNTKMPSIALISADATYAEVFGMPISPPIMKGLGIDAIRVASSPMPIDGDLNQRREFIKHRGLTSSYLEHKILENLLQEESISAVKTLQIAAKNGIPLYTINRTNIDSILPTLTISARDKTDIQNVVNAGKEVTVSRDNITLGDWTGVGYIARDPNTGTGAYMISNELGGGGTVKTSNPKFDKEHKIAWFVEGQPLGRKSLPLWWYDTDFTVFMSVLPIWQHYGYTTGALVEITTAEMIKDIARRADTWIFYYAGHGGCYLNDDNQTCNPDKNNFIAPGGGQVTPNDIKMDDGNNSDVKIVFLNACRSFLSGNNGFPIPFGIDGDHKGDTRGEAFLGWKDKADIINGANFAMEFWILMGSGMTVNEAIDHIKGADQGIFDVWGFKPFDSDNIDSIEKEGATLVP